MKASMKQATVALVLGLAALGTTGKAQAAGTAAGTAITNTATLAYRVGGIAQTGLPSNTSNTTSIKVDRKINLTVVKTSGIVTVNPGQAVATLSYSVTNNGNDTQDFALSAIAEISTTVSPFGGANDNFDGTGMTINVGGVPATSIVALAPDGVQTVTITFAIPMGQVDNDVAVYGLKAVAKKANSAAAIAVVENVAEDSALATNGCFTVFADAAGTDDAARDASHSDRSACKVSAPQLTISKTATTIWDPLNFNSTPRAIPGAYVQYAITISNAAGATNSASLTTISDILNGATPLDPDLMNKTLGTAVPTPDNAVTKGFKITHVSARPTTVTPKYYTTGTVDSDGVDIAAGTITVDFTQVLPIETGYTAGQLKQGESITFTYNVKIN